jgi:quinol monooxygenase YgiN
MIYLNVVLTVKDTKDVDTVRGLLAEQARLSKQEPGCQRFDVYHSKNDGRVFIIVEHWDSQADLDLHREALAYTTVYKPKVIPLVDRTPHPAELVG